MFARFFRSSSNNDLEAYRRGYPGKTDNNDPRQNKNLLFYRNQHPMEPDQILIDMFHDRIFGKYNALESGHSFIQWLFPIQEESPYNWQAQQLQKHEIAAMRRDGAVLQRIFKSLELMLDFYGFDVKVADHAQSQQRARSTSNNNNAPSNANNTTDDGAKAAEKDDDDDDPVIEDNIEDEEYDYLKYEKEKNKNKKNKPEKEKLVDSEPASKTKRGKNTNHDDDDEAGEGNTEEGEEEEEEDEYAKFDWSNLKNARCEVARQADERVSRTKFNNLINHAHNNLRITRILKCLGEMGLENMKIAVLVAFRREIFETGALRDLADSYMNYWSGTLYNDEFRAQLQTVPTEFQPRGVKRK